MEKPEIGFEMTSTVPAAENFRCPGSICTLRGPSKTSAHKDRPSLSPGHPLPRNDIRTISAIFAGSAIIAEFGKLLPGAEN